jgi:hypothetical protein
MLQCMEVTVLVWNGLWLVKMMVGHCIKDE